MAEKIIKPSAGAEGGNPQAVGASSPNAKRKKPVDAKLIKKLFQLDPLDWARYPDDSLAFIAPDGSKHKYTGRQLEELSEAPAGAGAGDTPAGVVSGHDQPGVCKHDAAAPACTERQRGAGSVSYPQGQE
jgi:hypothetical protein